jgi:hypothetical protein
VGVAGEALHVGSGEGGAPFEQHTSLVDGCTRFRNGRAGGFSACSWIGGGSKSCGCVSCAHITAAHTQDTQAHPRLTIPPHKTWRPRRLVEQAEGKTQQRSAPVSRESQGR